MPTQNMPIADTNRPPARTAPFFWLDVGLRLLAFAMIVAAGLWWDDASDMSGSSGIGDAVAYLARLVGGPHGLVPTA
ncbi:hypothetical protein [Sphingomonas montana]|uniref:hypothetical protein n=1 Tax=Sphingomonas montana TaxID=1843236 RepID=UPI00096C6485|nr:hypothetical protein [Sphingomonas montana]